MPSCHCSGRDSCGDGIFDKVSREMTRLSAPLTSVTVSRGDGVPSTLRARTRGRRRTRRAPRSRRCLTRSQSSRWDLLSQRCLRSIRISPLPHSQRERWGRGPRSRATRNPVTRRGAQGSGPFATQIERPRPTVEGDSESRHTTWRTRISPLPHSQRERSRPTAEGYSESRHTTWRTRISPLPHSQRERSRPTAEGYSESRHTTWRTRISPFPHSQRERSRPTAEGYSDTGRLHMDDLARRAAAQARARA